MFTSFKTFGTISLILGIISLVLFCVPLISLLLSLVGITLGLIASFQLSKADEPKARAVSGTIISGIALIISIFWNLYLFDFNKNNNLFDFFKPDTNQIFNFPIVDDFDTNYSDIDSLMLNDNEMKNIDNSMSDTLNSPGSAPE